MSRNGITFNELRELLLALECSMVEESKRTSVAHPAAGMFLLLRPYSPKEIVSARDMLVVRRQLVDNGLIESSAFDQFLQKASA